MSGEGSGDDVGRAEEDDVGTCTVPYFVEDVTDEKRRRRRRMKSYIEP
jgi:hypothetical protein